MRLQAAFDRAALAAAGAIDPQVLAASGNIVLAEADAELIARRYLVANVEPMQGLLADQTAAQVAAGAPDRGPRAGPIPRSPVTGEIALPSGLLALAGVGDSVTFRIQSSFTTERNLKLPSKLIAPLVGATLLVAVLGGLWISGILGPEPGRRSSGRTGGPVPSQHSPGRSRR